MLKYNSSVQFKSLFVSFLFWSISMFDLNSSKISALRFNMLLAWVFPMLNSLANSRHSLQWTAKFIRSTLSLKYHVSSFLFKINSDNLIFYSQYPGYLNTNFITVNIYKLMGISKQSFPTWMHICRLNWLNIGLSVSVIPSHTGKLNWLMIMFAE